MRSLFAAASLTFLLALAAYAQQRAIVNPSLELPVIADNSYQQTPMTSVPGWLTTHPIRSECGTGCRPIEMWRTPFNGVTAAAGSGSQWAELNAYDRSMIYQAVCMTPGESFTYSFLHRGRDSATVGDVMDFRIGIPTGLPSGSIAADSYSLPIVRVTTTNNGTVTAAPTGNGTINAPVSAGNGWVRYSGTYTYPAAQPARVANIGFAAVSTAGGNISVGNFIDDWRIQLQPYIELSAASTSGLEGTGPNNSSNTPANGPSIRIGGQVTSPIVVRMTVNTATSTATLGIDYSLTVPFLAGSTDTSVDITIPAGTYDGSTTGIFPVPFSIHSERFLEPDETVNYSFTLITQGVATVASVSGCGVAPISTGTYTILNDDFIPTAAGVEIAGRVVNAGGSGIGDVELTLQSAAGNMLTVRTNQFGYFRIRDVPSGDTYLLFARSKRYVFSPRILTVDDNISGLTVIPR